MRLLREMAVGCCDIGFPDACRELCAQPRARTSVQAMIFQLPSGWALHGVDGLIGEAVGAHERHFLDGAADAEEVRLAEAVVLRP